MTDIEVDQATYRRFIEGRSSIDPQNIPHVNVRDKLMGGLRNIALLTPGEYSLWVADVQTATITVASCNDIRVVSKAVVEPAKPEAPPQKPKVEPPKKPEQTPENSSPEGKSISKEGFNAKGEPDASITPKAPEPPKAKLQEKPISDLPKGICYKCRIRPDIKKRVPKGAKWSHAGTGKCSICKAKKAQKLYSILG